MHLYMKEMEAGFREILGTLSIEEVLRNQGLIEQANKTQKAIEAIKQEGNR